MNSAKRSNFGHFGVVLAGALAGVLAMALSSSSSFAQGNSDLESSRQRTLLDADWLFHRGDVDDSKAVVAAGFDDHQWQPVHLPHDYVLDETYNQTNVRSHGYLPFKVGWYRKHLSVPESVKGKVLRLDFDGVFRNSEVWLNGTYLGSHLSGYTPFSYDITGIAKPGEDNIITVRVDPTVFEGWWYEGGGIYRHVYLTALPPVHVAQWGTYVVSTVPNGDQGADGEADLNIQTTIENSGASATTCSVMSEILGPDGKSLQTINSDDYRIAKGQHDVVQLAVIPHPKLWSLETPNLYQLRTTVFQGGKLVDSTTTTFGVRTIRYDAEMGFFLNGKHVEIYGLCNHQDLSALGNAVPDNLQAWRVAQIQKAGGNAWRTAHNPPNEALLDACDRMGMMVMDENRHLGYTYLDHSPKGTTATNLSDLVTMIKRDRNHPSIIMWSMCNEEGMQGSEEGAALFTAMMKVVHQYDATRPITSAMNAGWLTTNLNDAKVEDIVGINYSDGRYDDIHKGNKGKPLFGSEDTNQKTTRGEYADDRAGGECSAYNLSVKGWQNVANRPFMCGSFTWTGFDYRGEPNPFGWPDISNNTGLMDLCGFPKDKFYYFQSCWTDKPMVHLLPDSWNWPKEGQNIRVIAFSNAKQVELFLNGQSLGVKDVPRNGYAEWQVPYHAGKLEAKASTGGQTVATEELATTGKPARIQIALDSSPLAANGEDAMVVPVSILDGQGRVVPDADSTISFQLTGGGHIVGTGNGNPADHSGDRSSEKETFHGKCVVIVQAGSKAGDLQLTASSPGLTSDSATIKIQ